MITEYLIGERITNSMVNGHSASPIFFLEDSNDPDARLYLGGGT
jgi:hypothetical protein